MSIKCWSFLLEKTLKSIEFNTTCKLSLIKAQLFWKRHKNLKNLPLVLTLLSETAVLSKQVGDLFQILWPSHNILTFKDSFELCSFKPPKEYYCVIWYNFTILSWLVFKKWNYINSCQSETFALNDTKWYDLNIHIKSWKRNMILVNGTQN